jgi:hypothetical protein
MKNKFTNLLLATTCIAGLCMIASCQKAQEATPMVEQNLVSEEIKAHFRSLGFDVSDIKKVGNDFLVEGDMIITPAALAAMAQPVIVEGPHEEQYRTYNLVTTPRTIRVSTTKLSARISQALDLALANYNQLNLSIKFQRVSSGGDIVVNESGTSVGGVAGFPIGNGNPYRSVTIYGGTKNYSLDVCEHVITHELGHCVGLRHTDWFNRAYSCGQGGSEGEGNVGAVHIPGTPTGYDHKSVMNSCFTSHETGEFSQYDKTALNFLY